MYRLFFLLVCIFGVSYVATAQQKGGTGPNQKNCDSKCRERICFKMDTGVCAYFDKPDCHLCTSSNGQCVDSGDYAPGLPNCTRLNENVTVFFLSTCIAECTGLPCQAEGSFANYNGQQMTIGRDACRP
jgi:hypothetical protein